MAGKVKYSVDEDIFEHDHQNGFYVAGFAAADGNITHDKRSNTSVFRIGLSKKDKDHLELIKNTIKYTGTINDNNTNNSVNMNIYCSKKIIKDLDKNFNVVPRKSLTYIFPERLISHPLVHHFMRGYFDGDGSFYFEKDSKTICLDLLGTELFLNSFKNILDNYCQLNSKVVVRKMSKSKIYRLRYAGNGLISKISSFLYKDANLFLDRKFNIIKHLL